jgi:hypothetical protein
VYTKWNAIQNHYASSPCNSSFLPPYSPSSSPLNTLPSSFPASVLNHSTYPLLPNLATATIRILLLAQKISSITRIAAIIANALVFAGLAASAFVGDGLRVRPWLRSERNFISLMVSGSGIVKFVRKGRESTSP